jgi:putative toxin-antitoxin system antitoxin component (TIGR02293 family)
MSLTPRSPNLRAPVAPVPKFGQRQPIAAPPAASVSKGKSAPKRSVQIIPVPKKAKGITLVGQAFRGVPSVGSTFTVQAQTQEADTVSQVRNGYPHDTLAKFSELLSVSEEQAIVLLKLVRSTIKRHQSEGRPFSAEISDRLYRAHRLVEISSETIGDRAAAIRWIQRSHPALGGVTALSLVDTTAGYERVRDELERIANGVTA